jgi:hypothetical protein
LAWHAPVYNEREAWQNSNTMIRCGWADAY